MNKKTYYQASITVEAVFLIPILLFVIFAFMYTALYFYDQVRIDTESQKAAMEQEQKIRYEIDSNTGMILYDKISVKGLENLLCNYKAEEETIEKHLKEIEKNLFQGRVKNRTVKVETGKIEIGENLELSFLTKAIGDYLPQTNHTTKHYMKMTIHNPEEFVRGYTALEEIAEQTGQGSKIKSTLTNLLKYMRG